MDREEPSTPPVPLVEGGQITDRRAGRELVISVRGLRTSFGTTDLHSDLDFDVFRGEIVGLVGGSGTGKSVLLRSIIGLQKPQSGTIEILGQDRAADLGNLQTRWGVLFQEGALFSSLTTAENIELPLRERARLPQSKLEELAALKIAMVGLPPDTAMKKPSELSGGMKKRVGLARALALDPELLFLDEPTAGLDPIAASAFDELILQLRDSLGLTVLMVTHDLDTLNAICDRVAVLLDKRVVAGTMSELMAYDHPWVRDYFHGPRARAAGIGAGDGARIGRA